MLKPDSALDIATAGTVEGDKALAAAAAAAAAGDIVDLLADAALRSAALAPGPALDVERVGESRLSGIFPQLLLVLQCGAANAARPAFCTSPSLLGHLERGSRVL